MPEADSLVRTEERILEEAIKSPVIAMMYLSFEIDRQLRLILAVLGRLKDYQGNSPMQALDLMALDATGKTVPPSLANTLKGFWELRNAVVHGGDGNEGLAMRAIDYGLRILPMLQSIPRPKLIVTAVVTTFSDQECRNPRPDVRGVIIRTIGSGGEDMGQHIYATRRQYKEGQSLSWEWDTSVEGWDETWYHDPKTGEIKPAWGGSLEFIGRPLEEI
jgi:hypothetical protein